MAQIIDLKRKDTSHPWGFKMQGGTDVGMPLFVAHVTPQSVAAHCGLKPGDGILRIGQQDTASLTHEQARGEIIRSGNEFNVTIQRGLVRPPDEGEIEDENYRPRMSTSEGDSPYQEVTPKTYKVLEEELPKAEAAGGRPASIFDKKRQQRSAYTKADKSGYIKPFGMQ